MIFPSSDCKVAKLDRPFVWWGQVHAPHLTRVCKILRLFGAISLLAIGVSLLNLVTLLIQGALRLRAVSLFACSVEKIARNTQMTTRVTEGARQERPDKRESLFFLLGLPLSFLVSRCIVAQRSRVRVLPLLNLK